VLLELVVENYAVVERLRVPFHAGLNLLTGETGSGKSIVVDALGLLLGARASPDMIRTGETRARVAGIFDVREQAALRRIRRQPPGLRRPAAGPGAVPGRDSRTTRPAASVLLRRATRDAGCLRRAPRPAG
jgi:DNA repair exonuclease SbcCD ATPase subunit